MNVNFIINDSRTYKEFSKYTFSNFLKKDIISAFQKSLTDSKIEEACNWCVESIVSGYHDQIFEKIISIFSKNINISNPRLPALLYNRFENYNYLLHHKGF